MFGTDRVAEFVRKGFTFISIGNDLHMVLTQAQTHMKTLKAMFPIQIDGGPVASTTAGQPRQPPSASKQVQASNQNKQSNGQNSDESSNMFLAACVIATVAVLGFAVWRSRTVPK